MTPRRIAARLAPARRSADAGACAADVLEVVPAVMDALRGAMRAHVGDGLSVPQFRCLGFIARTPGCSVGDVAAFLGVTMPTASAMVDRLARAGAVAPDADPQDRRRLRLTATPEGRGQLAAIRRQAQADFERLLADRTAAEIDTLRSGLAVLRQTFVTR